MNGDLRRIHRAIDLLRKGDPLPASLRDHQLLGKLREYRELHISHDWLLVYKRESGNLHILCIWLVSHKKLKERERFL